MSLYKRRRSKEKDRPVSMYTGSSSPVLVGFKTYTLSPPLSPVSDCTPSTALTEITNTTVSSNESSGCGLDTTLTSCSQSENFEQYDLEVSEINNTALSLVNSSDFHV